jgi:hypothetical protein
MMATVTVGALTTFIAILDEHRYPSGEWATLGEAEDGITAIQLDDRIHGTILVEWPEGDAHRAIAYWNEMMRAAR